VKKYQIITTLSNNHKVGIPNSRKMLQMAIEYNQRHIPFEGPPKFTQIGIFGLKINHVATLIVTFEHDWLLRRTSTDARQKSC
jgi:hypothetical protein